MAGSRVVNGETPENAKKLQFFNLSSLHGVCTIQYTAKSARNLPIRLLYTGKARFRVCGLTFPGRVSGSSSLPARPLSEDFSSVSLASLSHRLLPGAIFAIRRTLCPSKKSTLNLSRTEFLVCRRNVIFYAVFIRQAGKRTWIDRWALFAQAIDGKEWRVP